MGWKRCIRISASSAAVLLWVSLSGPSSAELRPWDQQEVTQLAKQLSESVTKLRLASINDPLLGAGAKSPRSKKLLDSLKALETACRQLARKLEDGDDRAKTTGVAKKLGSLIRRTQRAARGTMTGESQWAAIDPAIDLINRLSPYYSEESPLLPPVQQR